MGSLVREWLGFLCFASIASTLFVYPVSLHSSPIHYDLWSQVGSAHPQGLIVYPAILLSLFITLRSLEDSHNPAASSVAAINAIVAPFVALCQLDASLVSVYGPRVLPFWVVPAFLLVLAAQLIRISVLSIWSEKNSSESGRESSGRKARSPRSPRSLIRSLSSPEDDENDDKDPSYVERVTPVRRAGRSPRGRSPRRRN
jgi:hypothetical protein